MILANMMQETGGFTLVWESMKYSADRMLKIFGQSAGLTREEAEELAFKEKEIAERVYGLGNPRKAKVLGNTEPGDGWRFRGGGFLQTTGRENYRVLGKLIGVDLEANPELIEDPLVSLKAACAEWHKMGLNAYADRNEFRACCNGINAGNPKRPADPNGYDERLRYFRKCSAAFKVPGTRGAAPDGDLEVGDFGPEIEAVQRRLIQLERYSGEADGVFTPSLRASVLAFQADHGLATTGRVDEATRALLMQDDAQPNWAAEVSEEGAEVAEEALRGGEEWWREPDVSLGPEPERMRAARVLGRDQVRWAEDGVQPDYRHLDVAFADREFELRAEDLEIIIKANQFEPTREQKRILFGLRGADAGEREQRDGLVPQAEPDAAQPPRVPLHDRRLRYELGRALGLHWLDGSLVHVRARLLRGRSEGQHAADGVLPLLRRRPRGAPDPGLLQARQGPRR